MIIIIKITGNSQNCAFCVRKELNTCLKLYLCNPNIFATWCRSTLQTYDNSKYKFCYRSNSKRFEFETSNQYIYWSNYNFNFILIFPKFLVPIFLAVKSLFRKDLLETKMKIWNLLEKGRFDSNILTNKLFYLKGRSRKRSLVILG